ncbi:MAG: ferrous iron transport protein B [Deltaproteobacteria bacterium]|jgi:ferrous iron transport protein B|nr:ferrous iron transport protein B [Deltaproteobacteria bacterium]
MGSKVSVALAGQPNSGKSTVFNALTGARQHVANYPGVTVEQKTGRFKMGETTVMVVDLPGTYSLTSYSLEETLAREHIVEKKPDVLVNVVDAANLKRNLYLTIQLLETERPQILALNMMDVAKRRGVRIDVAGLGESLGVRAFAMSAKSGQGLGELKAALAGPPSDCASCGHCGKPEPFRLDYGPLESAAEALTDSLKSLDGLGCSPRWLALKLLEGDVEAQKRLANKAPEKVEGILAEAARLGAEFERAMGLSPARHLAFARHKKAKELTGRFQTDSEPGKATLSDKIDKAVCHRVFGPIILVAVLLSLYQISIVYGGALAAKIWPLWGQGQDFLTSLLPSQGFLDDPVAYSLGVWVLKSLAAVLNYLPIFILLFALIAILEDSGYMPRMAFLLDRLFRRFGLHGQSTLPLILGGVYVGGCAIPAIMATRAIPDEKARLATILIAPMMNCLAKVPLYLILIGAFFSTTSFQSSLAMFFIATVTLLMALPVARVMTLTVLKGKVSAPFILELPPYHAPGVRTVLIRTVERVWLFLKKIVTVVLVVSVVVFGLISFPKLNAERFAGFEAKADAAKAALLGRLKGTPLDGQVSTDDVGGLILLDEAIKTAKIGVTEQAKADAVEARFAISSPRLYGLLKGSGPEFSELKKGLRKVASERKKLRREMKEETFQSSVLGMVGLALEPITKWAGFDWRVNIALLSAFAAKENSAATLGAIYGLSEDPDGAATSPAQDLKDNRSGFTPLHALALMIFMALYPPCLPASIMVRLQANSTRWMLFALAWQSAFGLVAAMAVFTGGTLLGLSGWATMWLFYAICLFATLATGLIPEKSPKALAKVGAG